MKKSTAILMLIVVTIIWGGGFIGIKMALDGGKRYPGRYFQRTGFYYTGGWCIVHHTVKVFLPYNNKRGYGAFYGMGYL